MDTNDSVVVVKNRKTNLVLDHYRSESMKPRFTVHCCCGSSRVLLALVSVPSH